MTFPRRAFLGSLLSLAMTPVGRMLGRKPKPSKEVTHRLPMDQADGFRKAIATPTGPKVVKVNGRLFLAGEDVACGQFVYLGPDGIIRPAKP